MVENFDLRVRKLLETHEYIRIDNKDLNSVTDSGVYIGTNCGNSPTSDTIELIVTNYSDTWIVQECKVEMVNIYLRSYRNGKWNKWKILDVGVLKAHMHSVVTNEIDGFMSTSDKKRLDEIIDYVHPNSHPASMIQTTTDREFVTRTQKEEWDNKSNFDGDYRSLTNIPENFNSVWIKDTEPEDKSMLWIDNKDEDIIEGLTESVLDEIRAQIRDFNVIVQHFKYVIEQEMDCGYFKDKDPGLEGPPLIPPLATYTDNPYAGNIKSLAVKRGNKQDLNDELITEGEFAFCLDTEELYIGNKGVKRLIAKVGGAGGSGSNVTGEYIMLETSDRRFFRIFLDNSGKMHIVNADAYFEKAPDVSETSRFKGLLINHVFGGGDTRRNKSVVSHSFVELYNNTDLPINLKGLSLQIGENLEPWKSFELVGIVEPRSSFLIRLCELTNKNTHNPYLVIDDYDMEWDIEVSDMGFKVYLTIGLEPTTYPNPANINGNGAIAPGYIDLIGVGGDSVGQPIDGYETAYLNVANNYTSVHRIDFRDTSNNLLDCEPLNWKKVSKDIYRPRCSKDGKWDIHYNKIKLHPHRPMIINLGFGENGDNTRTFSWQTTLNEFGYLKYKKIGDLKYKYIESDKITIRHGDADATRHIAIARDLVPGQYEYCVGEEGSWSDIYYFDIVVPSQSDTIRFIQTTDQQAIDQQGYEVWKTSNKYISENEQFDFILNTGDISNDANKSYQWRYYYEYSKYTTSNVPHMITCGNNDLINKLYPDAFMFYCTAENSPIPSVYSWNYGYIHFISVNSNIAVKVEAGESQPTPIADQIAWLEKDLSNINNKKRWTIVIMHESPYNIVKNTKLTPFHEVFAKHKVDLVLSGHHHMASRSHGMGPLIAGKDNVLSRGAAYEPSIPISQRTLTNGGVVYVMSQATGEKLEGKTAPALDNAAPWRGRYFRDFDPSYIMYNVTYNRIEINAFKINNIYPPTDIHVNPPIKEERDNLIIVKKELI